MNWIATFNQKSPLRDHYLVLEDVEYDQAHKHMEEVYYGQWASLYSEGAWQAGGHAKYFPDGPLNKPDQVVGDNPPYANQFMVCILATGNHVLIHRGPVGPLTRHQAFCLAAWLIRKGLNMPGIEPFSAIMKAVLAERDVDAAP